MMARSKGKKGSGGFGLVLIVLVVAVAISMAGHHGKASTSTATHVATATAAPGPQASASCHNALASAFDNLPRLPGKGTQYIPVPSECSGMPFTQVQAIADQISADDAQAQKWARGHFGGFCSKLAKDGYTCSQ
jgi:hypothetical protein